MVFKLSGVHTKWQVRVSISTMVVACFLLKGVNVADLGSSEGRVRRKRLFQHITFFFDPLEPEPAKTLRRVVASTETYGNRFSVHVMVHTNKIGADGSGSFSLDNLGYECTLLGAVERFGGFGCPNVTITTHDVDDLKHPHYLTWMHRAAIARQLEDYPEDNQGDIYIYTEDDVLFTRENLDYYLEYSRRARDVAGCNLGFVQVLDPMYTGGTDRFWGVGTHRGIARHQIPDSTINTSDISNTTNGGEWARLEDETNYWGGWIMGNSGTGGYEVSSFASSNDFPMREFPLHNMVREIAAWGWNSPRRYHLDNGPEVPTCTVVPLVEIDGMDRGGKKRLEMHPGAKSYHLTEGKYVGDDCRSGEKEICGHQHGVLFWSVRWDYFNFSSMTHS